jgi:hypothetical protein
MQLRSWAPRRPSAKLKDNLFPADPGPAEDAGPAFRLGWLAPAALTVLLIGLQFNQRMGFHASGVSGAMVAAALSNQSEAAWLPGSFPHDANSLPAERFEWTNGSGSTSSTRPLLPSGGQNE